MVHVTYRFAYKYSVGDFTASHTSQYRLDIINCHSQVTPFAGLDGHSFVYQMAQPALQI